MASLNEGVHLKVWAASKIPASILFCTNSSTFALLCLSYAERCCCLHLIDATSLFVLAHACSCVPV